MNATINPARVVTLTAILSAALLWPAAAAQQEDNWFCKYSEIGVNTYYFSGVFPDDDPSRSGYPEQRDWADEFAEYIERNYDVTRGFSFCEDDIEYINQSSTLKSEIRSLEESDANVVMTGWMPATDDFTASPLRDFRITVPRTDRSVNVCVRDHECEDGDEVRVSVNGSVVLREEIVNEWACRSVSVTEGRNSIELFAINGTGRKGNCSYADANTGEIRVEGQNIETQSWRHRGGAGSSAEIIVTVR